MTSWAKRLVALVAACVVVALAVPAIGATGAVTISDNKYTPTSITITVNDSVTWAYPSGSAEHSVTARPGQAVTFDSSPSCPPTCITPGGHFGPVKFTRAGTFTYYCRIHGSPSGPCSMCGTVVVKSVAKPTPTHKATPTPKVTPKPTPKPTVKPTPKPTAAVATPLPTDNTGSFVTPLPSTFPSPIAFGSTTKKSNRGPLIGLAIGAVAMAAGGALLFWFRTRGSRL